MKDLDFYLRSSNWNPKETHQYSVNELWFPLANHGNSWEAEFHELMLRDKTRMENYMASINAFVKSLIGRHKEKETVIRVLDIGSGSGIWVYLISRQWELFAPERIKGKLRIYSAEVNTQTYNNLLIEKLNHSYKGKRVREKVHIFSNHILSINCNVVRLKEALSDFGESLNAFDVELYECLKMDEPTNIFNGIVSECLGGIGDDEGFTEIIGKV
ncbi:MAG: hypothetical protein AAF985_27575, partial [Bacteroidota bacterium]